MKDQPQQPMAPMAFYPTWQSDPTQGWQNQFIQPLPQNTTSLTPLNSLEFQPPQGYAAYQPNGYVQTAGIGFDPNYGRTYAATPQRYDFQTNQITPINQVSLQSVSFAPTVTYAGQVSTGPAVVLSNSHHNTSTGHLHNPHDQLNLNLNLNKPITSVMSGNEMPGYPRVNSVLPPRSLNCNGYPGQQDYVGGQTNNSSASSPAASTTTTTTASTMHPPQTVPQSPSRTGSNNGNNSGGMQQPPRPNSNNQMYTQQSPNPYHNGSNGGNVTPNHNSNGSPYLQDNHHQSPNVHQQQQQQQTEWNAWNQSPGPQQPNDMFNQSDRVNLNSRIKTMILNKNDQSNGFNPVVQGQAQGQQTQQTGHFLSYSHHLRDTITTTPTLQPINSPQLIGSGNESSTENIGDGGNLLVGGGPPLVDQLKVSDSKKEQHHEQQQSVFEHKQQLIEKSNSDPGGILQDTGGGGKKKSSSKSASSKKKSDGRKRNNHEQQIDSNKSSSNNYNNYLSSDNNNSQSSSISSLSSASSVSPYNHTYPPYSSDNLMSSKFEPMSRYGNGGGGNPGAFQPHPGAFHTPQPHQNPYLTNVKKEPGLLEGEMTPLQPQKYDGYEKNYQNFIRYADYCDAQQQNQTSNYYSPYNNYPSYQNYPNANYNQNYQAPPSTQQPPQPQPQQIQQQQQQQQPLNVENSPVAPPTPPIVPVPHQTNFEQQIPLHTYPIPKNNNSNGSSSQQNAEVPIKLEAADDNSYLGEEDSQQKDPSDPLAIDNTGKLTPLPQEIQPPHEHPQIITNEIEEKPKTEDLKTEHVPEHIELKEDFRPILSDKDKMEKANKPEIPECDCFPSDKNPPEPGSFYTHLGCAATIAELREETEKRVGLSGKQLRIEKVIYTGKEGKSSHGCPIAKWIIRRVDQEEKLLFVVKKRQGHRCKATFIVVCIVVWDGIPVQEGDSVYRMLAVKLNKFGLPTVRRCATNENRTCACQGLDPDTYGASYSFGCSWSMYYNGCKYARSKTVRKFRLSVKNEEAEIEERMNILATMLSPLYVTVAPQAFQNQVQYEREAPDCRLGLKPGKPFSGVTCCLDFCAHTHRDLHNMQEGCTVQVTLLKPLPPGVPQDDEQLHVLPLYIMDTTDEFDSEEAQKKKNETGAVQALEKFPTEVRVRSTPLQPCRRHGKKRGNAKDNKTEPIEEPEAPPPPPPPTKKEGKSRSRKSQSAVAAAAAANNNNNSNLNINPPNNQNSNSSSPKAHTPKKGQHNQNSNGPQTPTTPNTPNSAFSTPTHPNTMTSPTNNNTNTTNNPANTNTSLIDMASMIDNFTDAQLQSNQISSTVLDSPYSYDYNTGQYVDNRQYYNQWSAEYYQNRGDPNKLLGRNEEIPDTTTRPGSNSSNSAFSPSIPDPTKTPTPVHMDDYSMGKSMMGQTQQQSPQQYHNLQQPEQGFVKPKPPDYNPGYGYHPNNYPVYHPPYTPYDPYQNYNYGYPPQSYHPPYHNMYPSTQTQIPGTNPPPPPPPTAVIPTPAPPSNWNLYPPHPHHNSHLPPAPPSQLCPPPHQKPVEHHQMHQPPQPPIPAPPPPPKETLGEVTEINDNIDCFQDSQMGGVAIALPHGSVIIECAKLEMHSTTSLKRPNRLNPTRMTLIFYQHRNLNRAKHGIAEWAEKMRLKKLGIAPPDLIDDKDMLLMHEDDIKAEPMDDLHHMRGHMDDPDMMDVEYH